MRGECGRCGALPQYEEYQRKRKGGARDVKGYARSNDSKYIGTVYDSLEGFWICMECGFQFTDQGGAVAVDVIQELEADEWENMAKGKRAKGAR